MPGYSKFDKYPVENFFDIPNPEMAKVFVSKYRSSMPELTILIYGKEENQNEYAYRVDFTGVKLICMPVEWKNANFQLAHPNECIHYLKTHSYYEDWGDEQIISQFSLFVVEQEIIKIKVISSGHMIRAIDSPDDV